MWTTTIHAKLCLSDQLIMRSSAIGKLYLYIQICIFYSQLVLQQSESIYVSCDVFLYFFFFFASKWICIDLNFAILIDICLFVCMHVLRGSDIHTS